MDTTSSTGNMDGAASVNGKNASKPSTTPKQRCQAVDIWLHPKEFDNELKGVNLPLPAHIITQTLSVSWEYTRSVIPSYTNWARYHAFCRVIVVGIIAEFHGSLVDIASGDKILGYDLSEQFDILFAGTAVDRDAMAREFRTFLLATAEKTSRCQDSELFRRYVDALAESPRTWFRIRDADALARFGMAAALTCSDVDDVWFDEGQLQILGEVGCTLYDAVAFYKHRAEGETNDTFAYVDPVHREDAFRRAREVLWALDVAWATETRRLPVLNFLRPFGGPIHLMMRRYRFVEEGLTIGKSETEDVVDQTRQNVKLWNRIDHLEEEKKAPDNSASYRKAIEQEGRLMFDGLAELLQLQEPDRERCGECRYRKSYGAETIGEFGGVRFCERCRKPWGDYIRSLVPRAAQAFPELRGTQLLSS